MRSCAVQGQQPEHETSAAGTVATRAWPPSTAAAWAFSQHTQNSTKGNLTQHSHAVAIASGVERIGNCTLRLRQVGGRAGRAAATAAAAVRVSGRGRGQRAQADVLHPRRCVQLALQRAEEADVLQVPAAHGAEGGAHGALGRARLRAAPQEDDLAGVDGVACGLGKAGMQWKVKEGFEGSGQPAGSRWHTAARRTLPR